MRLNTVNVITGFALAFLLWVFVGAPHPLRFTMNKVDYTAYTVRQMGTVEEINDEARKIFKFIEDKGFVIATIHNGHPTCQRICSLGKLVSYSRIPVFGHEKVNGIPRIYISYNSEWQSERIIIYDPDWTGSYPTNEYGRPLIQIEDNIYFNPVPGTY